MNRSLKLVPVSCGAMSLSGVNRFLPPRAITTAHRGGNQIAS